MIKNYLKIAVRNLLRHKAFSFINITGLAIGIASCLLLFTVVKYELSYDKFQPNADRVYRITRSFNDPQSGVVNLHLSTIAPAFAPLLRNDFKEIEEMTQVYPNGPTPARFGEKMFNEEKGFGFIAPDGGGDDVFFHVSALREGDDVTKGKAVKFEVGKDEKSGKTKAIGVDLV